MGTISVNRLAGLSLIFGPLIAFVFFLIEPGGLFIDSVDPTDTVGAITAKASNASLTKITNIAIVLGLAMILSGLYALMRNVTLQGSGKAFVQMGFFMMFVGLTGWILSTGIDFILADATIPDSLAAAVPISHVGSALLYAGGDYPGVRRLHLRPRPLDQGRLQPDNLHSGFAGQPGSDDLLPGRRPGQRQPRHIPHPGPQLLRPAGHLVRIPGRRHDEQARPRSLEAIDEIEDLPAAGPRPGQPPRLASDSGSGGGGCRSSGLQI